MPELKLASQHSIYYQDPNPQGSVPVILLHGLGVTSDSWELQFPVLRQAGFRPLAPDIPGFGKSSFTGKGWSIRLMGNLLAEFIQGMQVGKAHLVGISMGGVLAQQVALDYPALVCSMVLANTFPRLIPQNLSGWVYFTRRFMTFSFKGLREQAEYVSSNIFPNPDQAQYRQMMIELVMQSDREVYRQAMLGLGLFNSTKRLAEIHVPTLVISGERDTTVPFRNQAILAQRIQGARQVTIKDAGHAVTIDQPDVFNQVMIAFLTQLIE